MRRTANELLQRNVIIQEMLRGLLWNFGVRLSFHETKPVKLVETAGTAMRHYRGRAICELGLDDGSYFCARPLTLISKCLSEIMPECFSYQYVYIILHSSQYPSCVLLCYL